MKYLRSQVLKHMGAEFRELKPEAESFRTLTFNIRVIMDEGNHVAALLLAGLTSFFLWLTTQQFMLEEKIEDKEWIKTVPFPVVLWEPPSTASQVEGKLFLDPSSKEELVGGSLWIYLISETGQSLFRSGGSVLPSGLSLHKDDNKGKKWRNWIQGGKDSANALVL